MVLSENWKNAWGNLFYNFVILRNRRYNLFSKIFLQPFSIFWKNHKQYINKQYLSRKPRISALIWHPKNRRGIIRRAPRLLAAKSIGARKGFLTLCLLWHGHALMIMPRPLSGYQIKAEIKGSYMTPWKRAWHHQVGVTMTYRRILEMTCAPCTGFKGLL